MKPKIVKAITLPFCLFFILLYISLMLIGSYGAFLCAISEEYIYSLLLIAALLLLEYVASWVIQKYSIKRTIHEVKN